MADEMIIPAGNVSDSTVRRRSASRGKPTIAKSAEELAAEQKAKASTLAGKVAEIAAAEPEPEEADPGEKSTPEASAEPASSSIHVRIPQFVAGPDGEPNDFAHAPDLRTLGEYLIEAKPALKHLAGKPIAYLFKRQGGRSAGVPVWGGARVASGVDKFTLHAVFVVWLAADHCQTAEVTDPQYEKLLFHELMHLGIKVDDRTEAETPTIRPHDVEAFAEEIAEYGPWRSELSTMRNLLTQSRMDFGAEVTFRGRM